MKKILTHKEIDARCIIMSNTIKENHGQPQVRVYPIPRGGIPVAYLLQKHHKGVVIVDSPAKADCYIDDIIDSGATMAQYVNKHNKPFYVLYNKIEESNLGWLVFPWEGDASGSIEDNIVRILQYIGEDPTREGLLETPKRVIKSWQELYSGYAKDPIDVFKIFNVGYDELVLMQNIEIYSTCEHHMLPFTGRAHVAYIADGKVIGASKLARLVDIFARRLQIQEQIGVQVVNSLMEYLKPKGAACIIEAKHLCMCARGVGKQHSIMKTSAMRGVFLEDSSRGMAARTELMSLLK